MNGILIVDIVFLFRDIDIWDFDIHELELFGFLVLREKGLVVDVDFVFYEFLLF